MENTVASERFGRYRRIVQIDNTIPVDLTG